jgi:hypothetical protein
MIIRNYYSDPLSNSGVRGKIAAYCVIIRNYYSDPLSNSGVRGKIAAYWQKSRVAQTTVWEK